MPNALSRTSERVLNVLRSTNQETHPVIVPVWRNILLQPLPLYVWFRLRWYWYGMRKTSMRVFGHNGGGSEHIAKNVIPYNLKKIRGYDRSRTERLISLLRSVHGIVPSQARVLVIGPRNEMELLLFRLYGFKSNNISAIDLFSYTPLIDVMDMHDIKFPDDTFDITYSAYTLRYSDRVDVACREITRCTKDGGLVAVSFVTEAKAPTGPVDRSQEREAIIGSRLTGGVEELLALFGKNVGDVLWREEYIAENPIAAERHCSVVFRLTKQLNPK